MKNVCQDVLATINVRNSMNVVEVFVPWLKNAVQTAIVQIRNPVPQPCPPLDKGNVATCAKAQSFVAVTRFANPTITGLFAFVPKDFSATLKMKRLDAKRNFVPPMLIVLETAFVRISDVFHLSDQLVQLIGNVALTRFVKVVIVSILAKPLPTLVVSTLVAQSSNIANNVLVQKDSLEMLKLNVSESPTLVFRIKLVQAV